jgi:hypothetical protein
MSIARQWLAKTRFNGKEYAYINQSIAWRLSHVFVEMDEAENNRGQSTIRLGDLYSVRMMLAQTEIQTSR